MGRPRSVAALGFGLAYALAGLALLLQAAHVVVVPWAVVAPGVLVVCGVAVLAAVLLAQDRTR